MNKGKSEGQKIKSGEENVPENYLGKLKWKKKIYKNWKVNKSKRIILKKSLVI